MPVNFLNIEPPANPRTAKYAVLPVPYEGTVTYKAGTAHGPRAILDASAQVEQFDEEFLRDFTSAGIATYPAVSPSCDADEQVARIAKAAGPIIRSGKFLITLGGEHSISSPIIALAARKHPGISVLQLDAHADLRDSYNGSRHSHASVMRRVLEATPNICQVGIRNYSMEEYRACRPQVERFITMPVIRTDPAWIDRVLAQLGPTVYVTIDIDCFDPAYAPGTGTPEPGGMDYVQVVSLLRRVFAERNVVAADIVEVRPIPPNHITEFLAAKLAYKIIAYKETGASAGKAKGAKRKAR